MVVYLFKCDFKFEFRKIYLVKIGEVVCYLFFLKKKVEKYDYVFINISFVCFIFSIYVLF